MPRRERTHTHTHAHAHTHTRADLGLLLEDAGAQRRFVRLELRRHGRVARGHVAQECLQEALRRRVQSRRVLEGALEGLFMVGT